MDAGPVGCAGHDAAERIDLPREVALADAADRGIAAHLPDGFEILREQKRACSETRRGRRGLGAGVSAADDDHVELLVPFHGGRIVAWVR